MKTVTDFPRKVVVHDNLRVPMPDGIELAARLWLPEDAETNPVPTILEHLPYRKNDGTIARDELTHPYIAGHGYACLRVDMRGNGDSEGLMFDEYEQQEWDDAIAVMTWVEAQPWSTGDWGMMVIIKDKKVIGVHVDGEDIRAGKVAIAGGAWSAAFGEQLGVQIPVEPQRGQIIHLKFDNVDTSRWSVINAFRGHYMVAWDDGRVAVGATRETGSGFIPHTTAEGIREVLSEALRIAPGLASAQLLEVRVGLRPYCADGLPVLGTIPDIENIYLATGHGASGLQLGPYSGKVIADMMTDKTVDKDLDPFQITRFI